MRFAVEVQVGLKQGVLDPQGQAVASALRGLGYAGVGEVRVGKWIQFEMTAASEEEARRLASEMAERVLANPVLERYEVTVRTLEPRRPHYA